MFFLFWSDSLSTIFQPCSRTRPTPINPPPPNGHDRCLVLRFTRKAVRAKTQGRAVQRPQASGRQRRCEALLPHQALHEAARALHSGHGVGARDTRSEEVQPSLGGLSFSRVWDGMGWDEGATFKQILHNMESVAPWECHPKVPAPKMFVGRTDERTDGSSQLCNHKFYNFYNSNLEISATVL